MALVNGTPVAVPDGTRRIEEIAVGDPVRASGSPLAWTPATVGFSQGTGPDGHQPMMVYVVWNGGEIIATSDHVFVLADLSLGTASRLRPGLSLLAPDGTGLPIEAVSVGTYAGGIHEIATSAPWNPGSLNGRLLSTGGVVTGDFQLQIHFQPADEPVVGTEAYTQSHATLRNL